MKFTKAEITLIIDILKTPYSQLFKEIQSQNYKEKKELIAQLKTFKKIYKKCPTATTKQIIIHLFGELEEINQRTDKAKKIIKTLKN